MTTTTLGLLKRTMPSPSFAPRLLLFLAAVGVSFVPSIVGKWFGPDDWYASIEKSSLTPPGYVFPIVWTTLYLLMGIALWRFWESDASGSAKRAGTLLFGAQLVLNGLWSYLFFGLHRPDLAMLDLALMWAAIAATIVTFGRYRRSAALLLVPYLVWVTFAGYLNFAIWQMQ
ncbi:MAG TPA: TspO/MBR family protein [Kofleriaceae bacterium]|nr:TspO/MBR family protein [Kofleriaceae bacterium]